jgi:hypothetical protein
MDGKRIDKLLVSPLPADKRDAAEQRVDRD